MDYPKTQGIKYTGSKLKILPYIIDIISKLNIKTIYDGFSGTTRVSQAFAKLGYKVICNDIADWSYVFGCCYLLNKENKEYYIDLINHLNNVQPIDGFISKYYGGDISDHKKPFQLKNTRKIDGIRQEIDNLKLNNQDKYVALTSLILAMDKVDSTLGHYSSYLNDWSERSFNDIRLEIPDLFINKKENEVYQDDIFNLTDKIKADLSYFDPPYGSNNEKMPASRVRYNSYYHIYKTVILYDNPKIFGKCNRRKDSSDKIVDNPFESFRKNKDTGRFIASETIERLIKETQTKYILLSYSNNGKVKLDNIKRILSDNGKIIYISEIDYKKNIMAQLSWTGDWVNDTKNKEMLFLLEK